MLTGVPAGILKDLYWRGAEGDIRALRPVRPNERRFPSLMQAER